MTQSPIADPDGGWFCAACHSLNKRGARICYSCGGASPVAAERRARAGQSGFPVALAIVVVLAMGGVGAALAATQLLNGNPNAAEATPAASPQATEIAISEASATDTAEPTPTARPTAIPTRSPSPSPSLEATPTPTAVASPTRRASPTPFPKTGDIPLPSFPVSVDGATVDYFSVYGSTQAQLIGSIQANAPSACDPGAIGCLRDTFSWNSTTRTENGKCKVTSVSMTATYVISLPRWDGPARVPGRLATWFKKTLDWIVAHEKEHMAIAEAFVPTLKAVVLASPCDQASAEANANKAIEQLTAQQDALDARTDWTWPPY